MNDLEFTGCIVKQAREDMGWSQEQLAEMLGIDLETMRKYEAGEDAVYTDVFLKTVFLLNMSADICIHAKHDESGLLMDRLLRQLIKLEPDQILMVCKAAINLRSWKDSNPEVKTWDDFVSYNRQQDNPE